MVFVLFTSIRVLQCHDPVTLMFDLPAMSSGPGVRSLTSFEFPQWHTKREVRYVGMASINRCDPNRLHSPLIQETGTLDGAPAGHISKYYSSLEQSSSRPQGWKSARGSERLLGENCVERDVDRRL